MEGVIEGRKSSGDHQDVERSHIVDERLRPIMSIQRLKMRLEKKAAKTVNNVLTVLSVLLKKAVEWGVIERMPCSIKLLSVPKPGATFYDFAAYERLVAAARAIDARVYLLVLLSGEAGLRSGAMVALEWTDIDVSRQQLCATLGVARASRRTERWAIAVRADDAATRGCAAESSTSSRGARAVSGQR